MCIRDRRKTLLHYFGEEYTEENCGNCDNCLNPKKQVELSLIHISNSPVIMVANKTDNHDLQYNAPEFYKLGLGDPYCVSAMKMCIRDSVVTVTTVTATYRL